MAFTERSAPAGSEMASGSRADGVALQTVEPYLASRSGAILFNSHRLAVSLRPAAALRPARSEDPDWRARKPPTLRDGIKSIGQTIDQSLPVSCSLNGVLQRWILPKLICDSRCVAGLSSTREFRVGVMFGLDDGESERGENAYRYYGALHGPTLTLKEP